MMIDLKWKRKETYKKNSEIKMVAPKLILRMNFQSIGNPFVFFFFLSPSDNIHKCQ